MVSSKMLTDPDNDPWKGILYFDLKIHNIYFNKKGKYLLKLRIDTSRGDVNKIKLSINGLKQAIYEYEYTSEPCFQEDPEVPCQLDDDQFRFELPEEFSEGEVKLIFEALQFTENPLVEPFLCGKGSFLIYPSSSLHTEPSSSTDVNIAYQYDTQLLLNQKIPEEKLFVNIGQLHVSVKLEMLEIQERETKVVIKSMVEFPIITPEEICSPYFSDHHNSSTVNSNNPSTIHTASSNHNNGVELKQDTSIMAVIEAPRTSTTALVTTYEGVECSFKKAWTSNVDQNLVQASKPSLTTWNDKQQLDNNDDKMKDNLLDYTRVQPKTEEYRTQYPENIRKASIPSKRTLKDLPLPSTSEAPEAHHLCGSILPGGDGQYEVIVQIHSACDLPSNALGRPPQPYVIGKTSSELQSGSTNATHVTAHPTYSPLWEELLVIPVRKDSYHTQDLLLLIFDDLSKSLITKFELPLQLLRFFHPYHLELEQVTSEVKAKLYISLMLKADELTFPSLHSEIFGLEVILRNFTSRLTPNFTETLIAVVRIVSGFDEYSEMYLNCKPRKAGIKTRKIKCPSSTLTSDFASMVNADQYNVAQISFSGAPAEQPTWNQMFFFHGDQNKLFHSSSAIVIEYYRTSQVVSFGRWHPTSPIGYSFYNLNNEIYSLLQQGNATMGLRLENIVIKDSQLKTVNNEEMTVNLILRLITRKKPDVMIMPSHYSILPVIDVRSSNSKPISVFPETEMRQVYPFKNLDKPRNLPLTEKLQTNTQHNPHVYSIMERQTKEIEKHRFAMKKMADDIIQLKSEATRLQAANNRLRIELQHRNEGNYMSSLPPHLENTTQAELVQRIVIVKGSLDEQIAINRELRLEIQSLHNQMIKKNEREKELYKLQDAHKNQQILLQKIQERLRRTKTLEETCKKQEKVIMRLEEYLANSKSNKGKRDNDNRDENGSFPDENRTLRAQLLNYERTSKAVNEMDRLQLHDKLQRAEARIGTLEKELMENTRKWARDKAELQLKLSETQMTQSFGHWSGYNQDVPGLFDMQTPPDSRDYHGNHLRRGSPKLSPLIKK